MRIVIDARWLGRTGIGRYCEELLDNLQLIDKKNTYLVLLMENYYSKWEPKSSNFIKISTSYDVYSWQEQLLLPVQLYKLKSDLIHFTSFNLPILYFHKFVVTIHDLTLMNFKNYPQSRIKKIIYNIKHEAMKHILMSSAVRSRYIYVPSEYVKNDLAKLRIGVLSKIIVTPEAVSENLRNEVDISKFGLPDGFVLYVGNYYPYKNVELLVNAFSMTNSSRMGNKLVLNGKNDQFQRQLRDKIPKLNMQNNVVFTGYTSDDELATLYKHAGLYVFPSLSEGFGLPGLEAMINQTPVLSSSATCLPEVYEDAAEYFNPTNEQELTQKIDQLLQDNQRLTQMKNLGTNQVKKFSWKRMAQTTHEAYLKS